MKKHLRLICPVDGCVLALAGVGFPLDAQMCPKCGGPMTPLTDQGEVKDTDVTILTPEQLLQLVAVAAPMAKELARKCKNLTGGAMDVRVPLALSLALVGVCRTSGDGWRPHEMVEAVLLASGELED